MMSGREEERLFFFFNLPPSGKTINEKREFEDCPRKCRYEQSMNQKLLPSGPSRDCLEDCGPRSSA
jgi:hypothetical protein